MRSSMQEGQKMDLAKAPRIDPDRLGMQSMSLAGSPDVIVNANIEASETALRQAFDNADRTEDSVGETVNSYVLAKRPSLPKGSPLPAQVAMMVSRLMLGGYCARSILDAIDRKLDQ
ncbi:MAG TPA: hypothetical protein VG102_00100 [Candidatus Paceibacterota bacterium]|jgi:hypothetical protein|nr:hypothetical protein [Candidatus Paceibacterota bacterium]